MKVFRIYQVFLHDAFHVGVKQIIQKFILHKILDAYLNIKYLKLAGKSPLPRDFSAGREALHLELKLRM